MSQLRASYTALSHVQDVPCEPGITWDIPGYPSKVPATQPGPMSYMSYAYLGIPATSQDVVAKGQLHSLVPCPRCPKHTWDYHGHPGMSLVSES